MNNRAENDVRPVQVIWHFLKQQPASVLWQRGDTKILAAVQPTSGSFQVSGSSVTVQHLDWLKATLRPLLVTADLTITVTCLEDGGGLLAELFNAAYCALNLLPKDQRPQQVAAAVTTAMVNGASVVDPDQVESQQATSLMTMVATPQEQILALELSGQQAINSSEFNELILRASQGVTRTNAQRQAGFERAVEPPLPVIDTDQRTIVIATKNPGKAREFNAVFATEGIQIKTLLDYPELPRIDETGATFEENARLKADQIAAYLHLPVLADDSGLMVDALGGRPGIYSARFSGDHNDAGNNAKLLYELTGVPAAERTATFHTTLVFAKPERPAEDLVVEGNIQGQILGIPRGDNGFGYDPLFYVPALDATLAQLTVEQKNQISHRAKAIEQLKQKWRAWIKA
ncbi:non-canonical purine NTP pyrophosphatase, rdgB HAM1 family [Latilactobacillus graminis DSM 20719]|uniref:dITP/XTP pyrophosphatase n=2 Tax=Latilactobacillus graminis TaxID=60519 RepID=A0AA89I2I7_9LACO|nr:non-canonical purine NTP pyrophosphatase, rdgB HAM1 family [Latilactobacillus graminis DSM 20719]